MPVSCNEDQRDEGERNAAAEDKSWAEAAHNPRRRAWWPQDRRLTDRDPAACGRHARPRADPADPRRASSLARPGTARSTAPGRPRGTDGTTPGEQAGHEHGPFGPSIQLIQALEEAGRAVGTSSA